MSLYRPRFPVLQLCVAMITAGVILPSSAEGQTAAQSLESLFQRGVALQKQGKFAAAIQQYEAALQYAPQAGSVPNLENLYSNLALLYCSEQGGKGNQEDKAEILYLALLKLRTERHGLKHPSTLAAMESLARVELGLHKYEQAEKRFRQLLELQQVVYGPESAEVAYTLLRLGNRLAADEQLEPAMAMYRQALAIEEKLQPPRPRELVSCLQAMAVANHKLGRYEAAERWLLRAWKVCETQLPARHYLLDGTFYLMANVQRDMGRFQQAEQLYSRAIAAVEARNAHATELEQNYNFLHMYLLDLGNLYYNVGLWDKAGQFYSQCLEIEQAKRNPSQTLMASFLMNLALVRTKTGDYKSAESLFEQAARTEEQLFGKDHPNYAKVLANLGTLYRVTDRNREAEEAFRRCLTIYEAAYGKVNPRISDCLRDLAQLLADEGRDDEALLLLERSLAIRRATYGPDHYQAAEILESVALLDARHGRWKEARVRTDEARRIVRRHVGSVLPGLPQIEQLRFLRIHDTTALSLAFTLGVERANDAETRDASAEWMLNSKGVAQQALAERTLISRDRADPRAARLVDELESVRKQLATMEPTDGNPPRVSSAQELTAREQKLTSALAEFSGRVERPDFWVSLDEVRQKVPPDAVLVEIVRSWQANLAPSKEQNAPFLPQRYAAWLIPSNGAGAVRLVDLGPADAIDQAVASVQERVKAGNDEKASERELAEALAQLAGVIVKPLQPELDAAAQWIISPDAALWLVPWGALPLADGSYAVEKHSVRLVISGRDLVDVPPARKTSAPVIFADPDYDLTPREVQTATKAVLRGRESSTGLADGVRSATRVLKALRLPGTAEEAIAVKPALATYCGTEPLVYTDQWALEGVFKAIKQPKAVHLSTHGFFLDQQAMQPQADRTDRAALVSQSGEALENPLLRCGLLLAGCNRRDEAAAPGVDDGILTGLEIVGTDLRGTNLVVLSACQTALGDVHSGDGVAGLRQAFQLAGARTVIATLWQIPDQETKDLMQSFFHELADGRPTAEALRQAQLSIIHARRRNGAAYPYYWAAFTMTGLE